MKNKFLFILVFFALSTSCILANSSFNVERTLIENNYTIDPLNYDDITNKLNQIKQKYNIDVRFYIEKNDFGTTGNERRKKKAKTERAKKQEESWIKNHSVFQEYSVGDGVKNDGILFGFYFPQGIISLEVGLGAEKYFPLEFIKYTEKVLASSLLKEASDKQIIDAMNYIINFLNYSIEQTDLGIKFSPDDYIETLKNSKEQNEWLAKNNNPLKILNKFADLLKARDFTPQAMYSPDTKKELAKNPLTPREVKRLILNYDMCENPKSFISLTGTKTVLRFEPEQKTCFPWFFINDGGIWHLDLSAFRKHISIGFGDTMEYTIEDSNDFDYSYAFYEYDINKDGYFSKKENKVGIEPSYEKDFGVFVYRTIKGSFASKLGVYTGDLIVSINNKQVKTIREYEKNIREIKKGEVFTIEIKRRGETKFLNGML